MKLTKQKIVMVINEIVDHYDIESKGFGEWLRRIGALEDHPDFDIETWNKIGNLLTSEYESNRTQGYEILGSFGFDDWDWLKDVLTSWNQAVAAQGMKTHSLEPDDPMYDITYDIGDYGGDLSRMVNATTSVEYLEQIRSALEPLREKYDLFLPKVEGYMGSSSDPTTYVMLEKPQIGWQIVHFGGGSGPPRVYPYAMLDEKTTSREFAEWFYDNFEEAELTGNIEEDIKLVIGLVKSIAKFSAVDSHLKQMLFLKKPEMATKLLGAKAAIGLEE